MIEYEICALVSNWHGIVMAFFFFAEGTFLTEIYLYFTEKRSFIKISTQACLWKSEVRGCVFIIRTLKKWLTFRIFEYSSIASLHSLFEWNFFGLNCHPKSFMQSNICMLKSLYKSMMIWCWKLRLVKWWYGQLIQWICRISSLIEIHWIVNFLINPPRKLHRILQQTFHQIYLNMVHKKLSVTHSGARTRRKRTLYSDFLPE